VAKVKKKHPQSLGHQIFSLSILHFLHAIFYMFFSTVLGGRTQPCAKTVKTAALVPSLGEGDGRRVRRVLRRSPGWKCLDVSNDERPTERNAPETKKTLESPQNQLISLDSDSFLHLHFFLFTFSLSNSFLKISNGTKRDEVTKEYTKPW
jgi:hypothetical protein